MFYPLEGYIKKKTEKTKTNAMLCISARCFKANL